MIRLFLADIDGCLAMPYRAFDLEGFGRLRTWAARAEDVPARPRIGLCSGRSYAYVEAIAQALDLGAPVLFESGGGRFDLPEARICWNPALTREIEHDLDAVRAYFLETLVAPGYGFSLDYGKRAQAGVVHPNTAEVVRFLPAVRDFVTPRFPELQVYETHASIDVVPVALTKAQALRWLAEEEGFGLEEVAFVGDTRGDAEALEAAGVGFAPQNASPAAKAAADVVTEGAVLEGVLEAYRWCLRHNGATDAGRDGAR